MINQGLSYMAWLTNHKDAFRNLVRDRLGVTAASQILWSTPRLICVAGDFARYDAHAVREHRRSIDLVRYRYFGSHHFGLETVASVTGHSAEAKPVRRRAAGLPPDRKQGGVLAELETKLLVYLKADPKGVDLVPGFTRDVTGLGHHGAGDLELRLRTERDLERAGDLLRLSYAAG